MQSAKEKVSNVASAAKEHLDISKAKAEEKATKMTARTKEEREIAEQTRKAKEAGAKMDLHLAKAEHAADKLTAKQPHVPGETTTSTGAPMGRTAIPGYPLGTRKLP